MSSEPNWVLLRDGKFDTVNGSDAESLTRIFAGFAERRPERLVLHFHGGLVSRQDALADADRLTREYGESGAESLFVVWESGVMEIIGQKLPQILQENLFQTIQVKVSQFVKAKLEKLLKPEGTRGPGLPVEFDEKIQQRSIRARECLAKFGSRIFPPTQCPISTAP